MSTPAEPISHSGPVRILHVDDDADIADLVATFLTREEDRFDIETAYNVSDGLNLISETDFDCIVSDYDMPGQNGIDFLEAVRDDYPDLPFILYTGKGSEEVASDAISAGVTDYLQKESGTGQYTILANRIRNAVERYRVEYDATRTRNQLQAIANNSADAIVMIDSQSRIRFTNAVVEDVFGYTPTELQGEPLTTIMPERHRDNHLAAIDRYLATGERSLSWSQVEFSGLHRDGTEVPLSISFSQFDQDGERRFIGIIRDVSDRIRREELVEEHAERFRQVAENIREVVWMSDPDKQEIFYVNPAYEEIWGRPVESLYNDPSSFLDAIHPEDRDRVEAALANQVDGVYDEEYRIVRSDGEIRWIHDHAVPVEDDAGDVHRIVGVASDITERKEREQVIARERYRLEQILKTVPACVVRLNYEGEFVFANERAEEVLGLEPDEVSEREYNDPEWNITDLEGKSIPDEQHPFRQVRDTGEPIYDFQHTIGWPDGTRKILSVNAAPLFDDGGSVESVIFALSDITDRKEREEELRAARESFESLIEASSVPIWVQGIEEIYYANNAAARLHGFDAAEDLVGRSALDFVPDAEIKRARRRNQQVLEQHEPVEQVNGMVESADGKRRHAVFTAAPTEYYGERALVAVAQDITKQRLQVRTLGQLVERNTQLIYANSTDEVAQIAVDIARTVIDVPLAGVHLLTDDDRLEAVAVMDEVHEEIGVAPAYDRTSDNAVDCFVWETFESGESRYVEDIEAVDDLSDLTAAKSAILQPLDERGMLIISATETNAFDEADRLYVELLSQTLNAALSAIEREEILRGHNQRLERLHDAAEAIHQADSQEEIAQLVVEAANDILSFPLVSVRYYDDEMNGLVPVATSESLTELLGSRRVFKRDGGSLNWGAYERQETNLYENISDIDRAHDADTAIDSLMVVPIGEHGTLAVGDSVPQSFDDSDRFHAELLATTAELALTQLARETDLIEQRDHLDRQNDRLEQFASVVSHDLRNPLNVAQGQLELAQEQCDNENLDAVARAHDRMVALIEDLLTLARDGEQIRETEAIELADLIENCWRNVETADARLEVDYEGTIQADRSRLTQLFENLLRNAIEHGSSDVTVTVGKLEGGFYLQDDGPGIPVEERQEVFEPGYSTQDSGTGFGLPIVKEIAQAHGWTVSLSESPDGGARFEITGVDNN